MQGKITKRSVDAFRPRAGSAETVLWDTELKGFGVRVQKSEGKASIVRYRAGQGRAHRCRGWKRENARTIKAIWRSWPRRCAARR